MPREGTLIKNPIERLTGEQVRDTVVHLAGAVDDPLAIQRFHVASARRRVKASEQRVYALGVGPVRAVGHFDCCNHDPLLMLRYGR